MKKHLLMALLAICASVTAKAQLTVRVVNNTSCPVTYLLLLSDGGCIDDASPMYTVPAGGQAAHTITGVAWTGGSVPSASATFTGARGYLNLSTCPTGNQVADPCTGSAYTATVAAGCGGGCPSYNMSWTIYPGAGYVLVFN